MKEYWKEEYGVDNPSQLDWVQEKKKQTNLKNFGAEWFVESDQFKTNCIEKYGVDNPMKLPSNQQKAAETLCKNGNVPVSKAEKRICEMLIEIYGKSSCIPSFPLNKLIMDCLLKIDDIKIDVEYDGWYWHKTRKQQDRARDEVLRSLGYKVLRIRSNNALPTKQQLQQAIEKLVKTKHMFWYIDLDI